MKITTIASSSAGCCYLVESGGEQLLIECGIPLKKIREALKHDLSRVVGCLVSHEHNDHCQAWKDIKNKTTIPVVMPYHNNCITSSEFNVNVADLFHDVACYGYIVRDKRSLLFYASDTGELPYRIKGLTHLMIEANYDMDILLDSEQNDALRARIADNHLSIDQAIEFALRHKDTLQEVHLLHLSDRHSNEADFLKRAQEALGVPVYVAKK